MALAQTTFTSLATGTVTTVVAPPTTAATAIFLPTATPPLPATERMGAV